MTTGLLLSLMVQVGRQSGVAAQLLDEYPNFFLWHCLNHRLKIEICDAVVEINGINHLQIFMDKLYSICNQSKRNRAQNKSLERKFVFAMPENWTHFERSMDGKQFQKRGRCLFFL